MPSSPPSPLRSGSRSRRRRRHLPALVFLAVLLAVPAACGGDGGGTGPGFEDADFTVLFVGNSLTYTNNLPGVVTTVAQAAGLDVAVPVVAAPNFALEDHWARGIALSIRQFSPDVVVMQQGPSSLPENQAHLAAWTDTLSRVVREVGAEPALLMVWPSLDRFFAFDEVRNAYRNAALGVDGTFVPAGEAFRVLHQRQEPGLPPYGADGFHPSAVGTVLTAMVVVGTLFDAPMTGLPPVMPAGRRNGVSVSLGAEAAGVLQALADSTVAAWREGGGGG